MGVRSGVVRSFPISFVGWGENDMVHMCVVRWHLPVLYIVAKENQNIRITVVT